MTQNLEEGALASSSHVPRKISHHQHLRRRRRRETSGNHETRRRASLSSVGIVAPPPADCPRAGSLRSSSWARP